MDADVVVVIMAGGLGKRIGKDVSKVLLELDGVPLIIRILLNLQELNYLKNIVKVIVVVGKYKDQIKGVIDKYINYIPEITYVTQEEPLGTGHALMCCKEELLKLPKTDVLILSGDVPLLRVHTMRKLIETKGSVKMITTTMDVEPEFTADVKDVPKQQINAGIYCAKAKLLCDHLQYLTNDNKENKYYLTDLMEIIKTRANANIELYDIEPERKGEILGVKTLEQLKEVEALMKDYEAQDKSEFDELKIKLIENSLSNN
jgi:bifunctional N-acetylglucosamine-1-phosphate-uridyltransferase/glucosamine-1-phosphate-acetyltransferase GlmU-like protein